MSVCVDLNRYDYNKTKKALLEKTKEKDETMIDKILQEFGTKIDNDYVLLNNEFWEESNCFYNIMEFIEKYYKFEDGDVYECFIRSDKDEMIDYKDIEQACENLGIDYDDLYDEESEDEK